MIKAGRKLTKIFLTMATMTAVLAPAPARAEVPYDLETGREVGLFVGAAALFGVGYWANSGLDPLTDEKIANLDRQDLSGFDRSATYNWSPGAATASDVLAYTSMVAPITLVFNEPGKSEPSTVAVMYGETLLLSNGAVYLLKNLIGRPRPYAYNDDPRIDPALKRDMTTVRSFPSGHTASAFASMVFLASVYGRLHPDSDSRAWVWGGCLATATTVGYLRYAAGRHYPTDILAGAVVGTLAGWLVPLIHERDLSGGEAGGAKAPLFIGYSGSF